MEYRKIALRVLIGSLCIAGISGVAILFLPSTDVVTRLVITAILTAFVATCLLVAIKGIESTVYRPLGLLASVLLFFIYIFGVSATWVDLVLSSGNDLFEQCVVSTLLIAGCGVVILIGTACFKHAQLAVAGKVLAVIWILILLSWLILLWLSKSYLMNEDTSWYILVPIQCYSALFALLLIHKHTLYKTIGVSLAMIACGGVIFSLLKTDGKISDMPSLFLIVLWSTFGCSMMALCNIITYRKPEQKMPWFEVITAIVGGIALAAFCQVIWYNQQSDNAVQTPELLLRFSAGFGILALTGLFTLVIGRVIGANTFLQSGVSALRAPCPRCFEQLVLFSGHSRCQNCGLGIHLKMESTGCRKCNYDLSGSIENDVCPECAEPIALHTTIE